MIAADYKGGPRESIEEKNLQIIAAPLTSPLTGFLTEIHRTLKEWDPRLVIASSDSHFGYLGSLLAKKLRVPFVFDLYHNYEDFGSNRVPGMKLLYNKALQAAQLVVCDSESLAEKVRARSRQIHVAPQATDAEVFRPLHQSSCRELLGLEGADPILAYVGNIDSRFDRDAVTGALSSLAESGLKSKLLIAGPGLDKKTMASPHVHYLGRLPQERIPAVICSADLCLIPYARTTLAETCNPCKLSEYIACNRPIVASNISNISNYLPKSGHRCYEPGDTDSLVHAISLQLQDPIIEERDTALLWEDVGAVYLQQIEKLLYRGHFMKTIERA